jgi:hypothetical protein
MYTIYTGSHFTLLSNYMSLLLCQRCTFICRHHVSHCYNIATPLVFSSISSTRRTDCEPIVNNNNNNTMKANSICFARCSHETIALLYRLCTFIADYAHSRLLYYRKYHGFLALYVSTIRVNKNHALNALDAVIAFFRAVLFSLGTSTMIAMIQAAASAFSSPK